MIARQETIAKTNELLGLLDKLGGLFMNVGDKVWFVPGEEHALHRDRVTNEYPWRIGARGFRQVPTAHGPPESEEVVTELFGKALEDAVDMLRRAPDPKEARKRIALIGPRERWPAVVRAVNDDGTVDLDVRSNQGGVTLHYGRVPVGKGMSPHTCYGGE